jgi:hypothetical protein
MLGPNEGRGTCLRFEFEHSSLTIRRIASVDCGKELGFDRGLSSRASRVESFRGTQGFWLQHQHYDSERLTYLQTYLGPFVVDALASHTSKAIRFPIFLPLSITWHLESYVSPSFSFSVLCSCPADRLNLLCSCVSLSPFSLLHYYTIVVEA